MGTLSESTLEAHLSLSYPSAICIAHSNGMGEVDRINHNGVPAMNHHEALATSAVGNWRRFDSFAWHARHDLEDADKWCIVYTSNRDSRLLDESNAAAIAKILAPYLEADEPDIVAERHSHWAVG